MPELPVILNNTPLVALWTLQQFVLLRELFGVVWIPHAVQEEFLAIESGARRNMLAEATWIQTIKLHNPKFALTFIGLDRGEAEVLALAIESNARLVIIDERKGRQYAQRLGLPLTGTLGVLLLAKEKGQVPAIAPLIEQLQAAGLHFRPDLIRKVLELAQETTNHQGATAP